VNSIPAATPARTSVAWLIWTIGVIAYILTVMQRTTLAAAGLDAADRFGLNPGRPTMSIFDAPVMSVRGRRRRHAVWRRSRPVCSPAT
jgi:hypothetical protein